MSPSRWSRFTRFTAGRRDKEKDSPGSSTLRPNASSNASSPTRLAPNYDPTNSGHVLQHRTHPLHPETSPAASTPSTPHSDAYFKQVIADSGITAQFEFESNIDQDSTRFIDLIIKAKLEMARAHVATKERQDWYGNCVKEIVELFKVSIIRANLAKRHLEYLLGSKNSITVSHTKRGTTTNTISIAFQVRSIFQPVDELLPWLIQLQVEEIHQRLSRNRHDEEDLKIWKNDLYHNLKFYASSSNYTDRSIFTVQCELARLELLASKNDYLISGEAGERVSPLFVIENVIGRLQEWQHGFKKSKERKEPIPMHPNRNVRVYG